MKGKRKTGRFGPHLSESRVKSSGGPGLGYAHGFRLKAVKLYLEEGYSLRLIAEELGCTPNSIRRWVDCYERYGDAPYRRLHC